MAHEAVTSATSARARTRPSASVATILLLVCGPALAMGSLAKNETLQLLVPSIASVLLFAVFWLYLRARVGREVFGEIGFLYMGFVVAYTALPGLAFALSGLDEASPLGLLLPDTSELCAQLWRQVLFQACVGGGYLLARGRMPSRLVALDGRERDTRTIWIIAAAIALSVACTILMSAPVDSYYDHFTRYDHLSWLPRKLVSLALRLSLGLYCTLLVFLFRNYARYKWLIPVVVTAICVHEVSYSNGARIQALIVLLQAVGLYHYCVRPIPLRWGAVACLALAAIFSGLELIRILNFDLSSARDALAEDGLKPASEFLAVFLPGFHLYGERAAGTLPSTEWPMFFNDAISLVTFGDFDRWNPMAWYARNYFPQADVAPFTLGPVADSAIWFGETDLAIRGILNGIFFAAIVRWFLRHGDRWWGLSVYVYCYATCVLTLKYSVFFHLNPIVKTVIPTLLLVQLIRTVPLGPRIGAALKVVGTS